MKFEETKTSEHISVTNYAGACGAEVFGVDLSEQMLEEVFTELKHALYDNIAIFFHDQKMDASSFEAFCEPWGTLGFGSRRCSELRSLHTHWTGFEKSDGRED